MYLSRLSEEPLSQTEIDTIVKLAVTAILKLCTPKKIILFGSTARGTASASSDLDFCIIFENCSSLNLAKKAILCHPPLSSTSIDYLFYDEETFKKKLDRGGVCELILKEGKVVFQSL